MYIGCNIYVNKIQKILNVLLSWFGFAHIFSKSWFGFAHIFSKSWFGFELYYVSLYLIYNNLDYLEQQQYLARNECSGCAMHATHNQTSSPELTDGHLRCITFHCIMRGIWNDS